MRLRPRKKRLCTCALFSHFQFFSDVRTRCITSLGLFSFSSSLSRHNVPPPVPGRTATGGTSRIRCAFFPIYGVKELNARACARPSSGRCSTTRFAALQENGNLSLWSECNGRHGKRSWLLAALPVALPATDDRRTLLLIISICIHDNLVPLRALSVKGASGTEGTRPELRSEEILQAETRDDSCRRIRALTCPRLRRDAAFDDSQRARALSTGARCLRCNFYVLISGDELASICFFFRSSMKFELERDARLQISREVSFPKFSRSDFYFYKFPNRSRVRALSTGATFDAIFKC